MALGKRPSVPAENEAMDNFNTFMEDMEVSAGEIRSDNQLLIKTIQYENAVTRFTHYILLDGQVGQDYAEATYDPETGEELTPEIPYIPHFDPLPEMVDILDEDGEPIQIRNPLVERDEVERLSAQTIIDSANQDVLDLAVLRNN